MNGNLEVLSKMEYPGRFIIIGRDLSDVYDIVVYGITGRSPSSQARKIVHEKLGIWVKPTDEEVLKKGNVDLLIYPAVLFNKAVAVSNGKQTADIFNRLSSASTAVQVLTSSQSHWAFEPDEPTFTPRISGCVFPRKCAALSIIKRGVDGTAIRSYFEVPLRPGYGRLISTYTGENKDPLPSFQGEPKEVSLDQKDPQELAEAVYEVLAPGNENDLRVSVAAVYVKDAEYSNNRVFIINRNEGGE